MKGKVTVFPMTEEQLSVGQGLVDAIRDAVDDYAEKNQVSIMDVLGAVELYKFNYLMRAVDDD